jgi:hypothetical protein
MEAKNKPEIIRVNEVYHAVYETLSSYKFKLLTQIQKETSDKIGKDIKYATALAVIDFFEIENLAKGYYEDEIPEEKINSELNPELCLSKEEFEEVMKKRGGNRRRFYLKNDNNGKLVKESKGKSFSFHIPPSIKKQVT